MNCELKNPEIQQPESKEVCLNCGAELHGQYCHECGQKFSRTEYTMKGFVLEYLKNAYMWDAKIFQTIWNLVRRPGYLTQQFLSGKVIAHTHPLKLNMFLLFVFVTLFVLFRSQDKWNASIENISNNEYIYADMQMERLLADSVYVEKIKASPRDTVCLYASILLIQQYSDIFVPLETPDEGQSIVLHNTSWMVVLPRVLVEDGILVLDKQDRYYFVDKNVEINKWMQEFSEVGMYATNFVTTYFPLIILFTAPLLSFSVRLIQRKGKYPHIYHIIFSLHYTAFLELLILLVYIANLIVRPSEALLQWIVMVCPVIYLALSYKRVYVAKSWFQAIWRSVLTNLVYLMICLAICFVIFILACIVVAFRNL